MLDQSTTAWPPSNGLTTKIVSRESTTHTISAKIIINAPAPLIWAVLRDTSKYPSWNSFCPSVTIHSQPANVPEPENEWFHKGTSFTLGVVMNAAKPDKKTDTQCRVTDISTPSDHSSYIPDVTLSQDGSFEGDLDKVWRISWTTEGSFVARGLRTERFSEIIDLGEGRGCEYRTWECQGGLLAKTVKWLYQSTLKEKFATWCEDLKREAEKRVNDAVGNETGHHG